MTDLHAPKGTGYTGLRWLTGRRDVTLILAGSLLPDLAWMGRRVLVGIVGLDPVSVSLWLIPWHTPWSLLFVSVAIGLCTRAPARVSAILYGASCIHILLDVAQTRFGNGVLLFYPFSMQETSWQLFWPEDPINQVLSLGSLFLLVGLLLRRPHLPEVRPHLPAALPAGRTSLGKTAKTALVCACALSVIATAAATRDNLLRFNVFSLGFVTDPASFEGLPVSLDRDRIFSDAPLQIEAFNGRRFNLVGTKNVRVGDIASITGTYRRGTIIVHHLHKHNEALRNLYSYLGLLVFFLVLLRDFVGKWLPGRRRRIQL